MNPWDNRSVSYPSADGASRGLQAGRMPPAASNYPPPQLFPGERSWFSLVTPPGNVQSPSCSSSRVGVISPSLFSNRECVQFEQRGMAWQVEIPLRPLTRFSLSRLANMSGMEGGGGPSPLPLQTGRCGNSPLSLLPQFDRPNPKLFELR